MDAAYSSTLLRQRLAGAEACYLQVTGCRQRQVMRGHWIAAPLSRRAMTVEELRA